MEDLLQRERVEQRVQEIENSFLDRYRGREAKFFFDGARWEALKRFESVTASPHSCIDSLATEIYSRILRESESVLIPDLDKIAEGTKKADRVWTKPVGEDEIASGRNSESVALKQLNQDFRLNPNELADLMNQIIGLKDGKLTVFAAYAGKFARGLKKAGFDVLASDPCERWVLHNLRHGLPTVKAGAEELEYREGTLAHAAFEPYPLDMNLAGYVAVLNSLARTMKGHVEVYDISYSHKREFFTELDKEKIFGIKKEHCFERMPRFLLAKRFYGAKPRIARSKNLSAIALETDIASMVLSSVDLKVLNYLSQNKTTSVEEMMSDLDLSRKYVLCSISRIQGSLDCYFYPKGNSGNYTPTDQISPVKIKGLRNEKKDYQK